MSGSFKNMGDEIMLSFIREPVLLSGGAVGIAAWGQIYMGTLIGVIEIPLRLIFLPPFALPLVFICPIDLFTP